VWKKACFYTDANEDRLLSFKFEQIFRRILRSINMLSFLNQSGLNTPRMEADTHTTASKAQIDTLLTRDESFFMTQSKEEVVESLLQLIENTKQSRSSSLKDNAVIGKKRTASEADNHSSEVDVASSVQSLRKIITNQIKAQLVWKKSCKGGSATWKYQGVCVSPEVFQSLMKSAINFKRKKISVTELTALLECGWLSKSISYGDLSLTGDVNVAWDAKTHEFSFGGKYGV